MNWKSAIRAEGCSVEVVPLSKIEQTALKSAIVFSGVGLHTGGNARVEVRPAEAGSGLIFSDGTRRLPALAEHVCSCTRSTSLGQGDWQIRTVEHLLSALHGMGVSSAEIALKGGELPILDGSALDYAEAIAEAGIVGLGSARETLRVRESFVIREGDGYLAALPGEGCRITVVADYGRPHAGPQVADLWLEPETYRQQIAPARTFGFQEEVEALLANGLALGGSLDNALVISDAGPSTPFRFENELARHKALDLIGDLALCGRLLNGHFIGFKLSHRLNVEMARQLTRDTVVDR